jgi:hypothetical protein
MAEPLATAVPKDESLTKKTNSFDQDSLFNERLTESEFDSNSDNKEGKNSEFSDTIPEPIYRSETSEAVAPMATGLSDTDLLNFIPPKAPVAGTPSVETLNKLKAVVENYKEEDVKKNMNISNTEVNQEKSDDSVRAISLTSEQRGFDKSQKKNSRFGINNLINRMTGASSSTNPGLEVNQDAEEMKDNMKDNIEIPAFLRRQAN